MAGGTCLVTSRMARHDASPGAAAAHSLWGS